MHPVRRLHHRLPDVLGQRRLPRAGGHRPGAPVPLRRSRPGRGRAPADPERPAGRVGLPHGLQLHPGLPARHPGDARHRRSQAGGDDGTTDVTMAVRGSGGIELTGVFNRAPRVLIADDDWLNRDLLEAYLVSSGCEVVTAAERAAPLDLALLDVQMPRMDGLALCRALKSSPQTRFVPVIIVTALDSENEKLKIG